MHPPQGPKGQGGGCISIYLAFYGYYIVGVYTYQKIHPAKLGFPPKQWLGG